MSTVPSPPLAIAGRYVGPGHPCFVIAEAGVNHDGDPALAHRLVEVAADAGADAVKFQTFRPEELVAGDAAAAPYQRRRGAATQQQMLAALTLPPAVWQELAGHTAERGLVFLSTAFDAASLDLLLELGVAALKVPSGELDNLRFVTPAYPGDDLTVQLTVKAISSRGEGAPGEVRWDALVTNQDDKVVATYDVLTLVARSTS